MKKRVKKILGWGVFTLLVMAISSVFLADHLMPPANGLPSYALSVEDDATALDRELVPLLARHPGQTGTILLPDGIDAYAARAISARQAGRSLDLQYYIWHDDLTGRMLANEAWEAAERGVRVRMLLDDMGIGSMDATLLTLDSHPNIELRVYNPLRNRTGVMRVLEMVQRAWGLNHRMHNKAWIADGRMAVVGGRNVGEAYFSAAEDTNFHDLDVMVFGPAVVDASRIFDNFWNSEAVVPIEALNRKPQTTIRDMLAQIQQEAKSPEARRYLDAVDLSTSVQGYVAQTLTPIWSDSIRILSDPPVKWRDDTGEDWLLPHLVEKVDTAQQSALLISPYFVPGDDGTAWLSGLSRDRGVEVAVVTNSLAANDVLAVHGGYARYRNPLLDNGVRLYEIRSEADSKAGSSLFGSSGASLHTKAFLVDGQRGFIGSFNMDPRSMNLNTEMGLLFDDPALGKALLAEYQHLAGPGMSYWVYRNGDGDLRWLDRATDPPTALAKEPDSTAMQRGMATVLRWLPIESQL